MFLPGGVAGLGVTLGLTEVFGWTTFPGWPLVLLRMALGGLVGVLPGVMIGLLGAAETGVAVVVPLSGSLGKWLLSSFELARLRL